MYHAWMYTLMMICWCEFDANWEGIIGMSGLLFMSRCVVLSSLFGMCTFMHSYLSRILELSNSNKEEYQMIIFDKEGY